MTLTSCNNIRSPLRIITISQAHPKVYCNLYNACMTVYPVFYEFGFPRTHVPAERNSGCLARWSVATFFSALLVADFCTNILQTLERPLASHIHTSSHGRGWGREHQGRGSMPPSQLSRFVCHLLNKRVVGLRIYA